MPQVEICAKCGSTWIEDDFEHVPGLGRQPYRKCKPCGGRNIIMEETMSTKKQCTTPGCTSPVQKEGLCYRCYVQTYGKPPYGSDTASKTTETKTAESPEPEKLPIHRTCIVPGCEKYRVKGQMCMKHYNGRNLKPEKAETKPTPREMVTDLPVYKRTAVPDGNMPATDKIVALIAKLESQVSALKTALDLIRNEAA